MIRVLIAEDHGVVRAGLEGLLAHAPDIEPAGVAANGEEAVAMATELNPDVVLMDLSMPVMDGIEATRAVLAERPETHVVILTSFSDRERIIAALDAGAIGYLLKDAEPDELVRAVRAAARGDAPLAPRAARELLAASRPAEGPLDRLSPREREVLACVREGLPNKRIAMRLEISEKTVKGHLTSIFETIGVSDRTAAALWARDHGV